MWSVFAIGCGGFLGAVSRYFLSGWAHAALGDRWAWGTLAVNVLGSFLIGALMTLAQRSLILTGPLRDGCTIGFLGALTTFSTFSWETMQYLRTGSYVLGGLNVVANCLLCFGAVAAGVAVLSQLS